jgi:hypothetical protein
MMQPGWYPGPTIVMNHLYLVNTLTGLIHATLFIKTYQHVTNYCSYDSLIADNMSEFYQVTKFYVYNCINRSSCRIIPIGYLLHVITRYYFSLSFLIVNCLRNDGRIGFGRIIIIVVNFTELVLTACT